HVINSEGGIIEEEYRVEYVADRVRTLGMAWMGLTVECARCHDHKYDPISQKDHFGFFAFFNSIDEAGEDGRVANAVPMIPAPTAEQQRQRDQLRKAVAALESKVARHSKLWTWQEAAADRSLRAAEGMKLPVNPALQIRCESSDETGKGLSLTPGVSGSACSLAGVKNGMESPKPGVELSKRSPATFSLWLQPSPVDKDVPLLSAMDYTGSKASVSYGKGIEVRLVDGEVEFRLSDRFPAYSVRVRSQGAEITPGQWSHVAVVYTGAAHDSGAMRVHASWIRVFADGREIPTRVLNDGAMLSSARGDTPAPTRFRVGWDNNPEGASYSGKLDEVSVYARVLHDEELSSVFAKHAMPFAVARSRTRAASDRETSWLRSADLRLRNSTVSADLRRLEELRGELFSLERTFPTVMVMSELARPRQTHVLVRGAYNAPGEKVEPSVPEALLGAWPEGAPKNRLGLARWLTKPDHPLTARVVVNRFWQQLFGYGLVRTSDNFGLQGEWPSHPELLDWLAREFIESGWNVKALMKSIVLTSTYRQDSSASRELLARDPENKLLARGPRFRLPAEVIRDQALSLAGLLKHKVGGPSVFPYQKEDLYKGIVVAADYPGTRWPLSQGDDLYRRSLYTFWKRTVPHPTMTTFDAPDREFCIVRRSTTNTPLQALTLLNDPIYVEAARKLAERALREGGTSPELRLSYAFRLATGRAPDAAELKVLSSKLDQMLAEFRRDESGARALLTVGASPMNETTPVSELAAYTAIANMILNLDEVITKG
ncbi:MAG TPA: DUF1553 domain-containing protein, partial [Bryobacteraceae bacterium]|nr:DUF1553 domain-containing protein [Bryobacteraceae bacterium]